jgi:hypothetical protein
MNFLAIIDGVDLPAYSAKGFDCEFNGISRGGDGGEPFELIVGVGDEGKAAYLAHKYLEIWLSSVSLGDAFGGDRTWIGGLGKKMPKIFRRRIFGFLSFYQVHGLLSNKV